MRIAHAHITMGDFRAHPAILQVDYTLSVYYFESISEYKTHENDGLGIL